jgi:hypothetical protein
VLRDGKIGNGAEAAVAVAVAIVALGEAEAEAAIVVATTGETATIAVVMVLTTAVAKMTTVNTMELVVAIPTNLLHRPRIPRGPLRLAQEQQVEMQLLQVEALEGEAVSTIIMMGKAADTAAMVVVAKEAAAGIIVAAVVTVLATTISSIPVEVGAAGVVRAMVKSGEKGMTFIANVAVTRGNDKIIFELLA